MADRVEIINRRIKESPFTKEEVADALNIGRSTLDNWIKDPVFNKENIALIGMAIGYDFSIDFKELKGFHFYFNKKLHVVGEEDGNYQPTSKIEQMEQRIEALEKKLNKAIKQQAIANETISKLIKLIS